MLSSVHFSHSVVSDFLRPHGLQRARPPCPSPTPRVLRKLMSLELVMTSHHLILCHPLFLLPSIFPSIRVFSRESVLCIRWPKYWRFSFSIRGKQSKLKGWRGWEGEGDAAPGRVTRNTLVLACPCVCFPDHHLLASPCSSPSCVLRP